VTAASVAAQSRYPVAPYHYYAMIGSGHTPSRSVDAYWQDCDIPWLTTGDVKHLRRGVQQVISETEHQISRLGMENSAARLHPAGTVALSRTASVGFAAILGREMATSQDFVTWTPFESLDARYLLWVFRAMKGNGDFDRMMYGSTHKTIYYPQLQQLRGPLPSVGVQRRVADVLDVETARIDTLISKNEQLAGAARRRFQRHHYDLVSGRSEASQPLDGISWLEGLPRGWSHATLGYLIDYEYGHPFAAEGFTPEPALTPVVRIRDVVANQVQTWTNEDPLPSAWIDDGAFVVGMDGDFNHVRWSGGRAALNQRVCTVWSTHPRLSDESLFEVLTYPLKHINETVHFTTVKHLSFADLLAERIPLPPISQQQEIARRLACERDRVERLEAASGRAVRLLRLRRQALVTAAVTGQIDV
jgi:type I restriction enzyme, S subunit